MSSSILLQPPNGGLCEESTGRGCVWTYKCVTGERTERVASVDWTHSLSQWRDSKPSLVSYRLFICRSWHDARQTQRWLTCTPYKSVFTIVLPLLFRAARVICLLQVCQLVKQCRFLNYGKCHNTRYGFVMILCPLFFFLIIVLVNKAMVSNKCTAVIGRV